jgi:uncharacterized membrane protein YphA (DoxX/SURF4 family)
MMTSTTASERRARPLGQRLLDRWVITPDARLRAERHADRVAFWSGVVFIPAGLVKFALHGWELRAFHAFGLPGAQALVIIVGLLETVGGVALIRRRAVLPVAFTLAVIMVVAIAVSGFGHGDVIPSLTLAPALLIAMVFLLIRGAPQRGS